MIFREYKYIFIVTYARSGSTLMQSVLNSLDGVQIRGENNNALFHLFQSIYGIKEAKKLGRWGQESNADEPWYGAGDLKPAAFQNSLLNTFVKNVLSPKDGVTVTGFKEIRHNPFFMTDEQFHNYINFLLSAFPDSKVIFNTRNANDVSKSAWLAKENSDTIKNWVEHCDDRFSSYNATSDRTILMRYDDYVEDHSTIAELCSFLEHDFKPDIVNDIFAKPLRHAK